MSIISRMTERSGERRYDSMAKIDVVSKQTGNIRPYDVSFNREFELKAVVSMTFWANQAQYSDAYRTALNVVASTMFGDIIRHTHEAMSAAHAGDRTAVLQACSSILRECEP